MADEKKDEYKEFKDKIDNEFDVAKEYLQRLKDDRTEIMIKAHRKVDYKIEENLDVYAKDLADSLEKHVRDIYGIGEVKDKRSFDALMIKHIGFTRKQIEELVRAHGDRTRELLEQQLGELDGQLTQQHYASIADEYLAEPDNLEHAINYLDLHKFESFEKSGASPDRLKRLFMIKGIRGSLTEDVLPTEMRKKKTSKKKPDE